MSTNTVDLHGADGHVHTWTIYKHQRFPKYSLRVKKGSELCDPDVSQIYGYLDVDEEKHFFFWFFESRHKPESDPLVLWLNGGPGCSSLTGLFMELGPCRVNEGGQGTTLNPYSWNNKANVIFLDQPVNVGFSYADGGKQTSTTVEAAADVFAFLQLFLGSNEKYIDLPFHVTGESYAGHYVPAIGKVIADHNNEAGPDETEILPINLASLAIGNGLTDPLNQYSAYADMAEDEKYGPILDADVIQDMRNKFPTCRTLINSCYKYQTPFTCVPGAIYCNNAMINPFQQTGLNIYDIRKKCDSSNPLCYSILTDIESFLNQPQVQQTLGVDHEYKGCNMDINMKFMMAGDWMRPYVNNLPPLLDDGIQILIYAGDADYICNWIGNKNWALELDWYGRDAFQEAEDLDWISTTTGKKAGEFRTFESFTYLRVYEAGHMVPYDQPEHSSDMINEWIKKTSF
ncbi:Alpha/Beta hydrolase protein [Polychytrium aggregatum]|uniref:Alpha/Beta hydrolase protein n=1 Tax=Polychytrium aggregatum TaxID=110093 RepID=UPI0022FF32C9|nr:Alpha/Beta hydrolase protein [Polychytrium aggregatum]KAI9205610.1 Alpha/Beta hydrolase protein [Polychytrium aggregatum]